MLSREVKHRLARVGSIAAFGFLIVTALGTLGHVVFAAAVAVLVGASRFARGKARLALLTCAGFASAVLLASARVHLLPLSSTSPFFDLRPNLYAAAHTVDLEMFRAHPLAGVGLECFAKAWPVFDDGTRFTANFAGGQEHVGRAIDTHSTWLGYAAEGGIFGVLVLAALVALALRARRGSPWELDVLLVFIAVFADVLTNRELAVLAGLLARSSVDDSTDERRTRLHNDVLCPPRGLGRTR